jgi:hypothetical protein
VVYGKLVLLIARRGMDEPYPKFISRITDVVTYREGPAIVCIFSTRIRNIIP